MKILGVVCTSVKRSQMTSFQKTRQILPVSRIRSSSFLSLKLCGLINYLKAFNNTCTKKWAKSSSTLLFLPLKNHSWTQVQIRHWFSFCQVQIHCSSFTVLHKNYKSTILWDPSLLVKTKVQLPKGQSKMLEEWAIGSYYKTVTCTRHGCLN